MTFFASVLTQEAYSEIKHVELKTLCTLHDIDSNTEKVEKLLKGLNPDKSCGPDECHPRILKETADELAEPINRLRDL